MKKFIVLTLLIIVFINHQAVGRVVNNILFISEYILNGSPGSTLSVSASGQLQNGTYELTTGNVTGNITTTSASPVLVTGMTLTPAYTGLYDVDFETSAQSTTGGNSINCIIFVNGVTSGWTVGIQFPTATLIDSGYPFYLGCHAYALSVTAGQSVQIFWDTTGGTATMLSRHMKIEKKN